QFSAHVRRCGFGAQVGGGGCLGRVGRRAGSGGGLVFVGDLRVDRSGVAGLGVGGDGGRGRALGGGGERGGGSGGGGGQPGQAVASAFEARAATIHPLAVARVPSTKAMTSRVSSTSSKSLCHLGFRPSIVGLAGR